MGILFELDVGRGVVGECPISVLCPSFGDGCVEASSASSGSVGTAVEVWDRVTRKSMLMKKAAVIRALLKVSMAGT